MIASCHFLARLISNLFFVKLGRIIRLIRANTTNIFFSISNKYKKKTVGVVGLFTFIFLDFIASAFSFSNSAPDFRFLRKMQDHVFIRIVEIKVDSRKHKSLSESYGLTIGCFFWAFPQGSGYPLQFPVFRKP